MDNINVENKEVFKYSNDKLLISKSKTANDVIKDKVSKRTLQMSTLQHIQHVKMGTQYLANMLIRAGENHDYTKLQYSDEYYNDFTNKKRDFHEERHLKERHHLNERVPDDVNLIDVLERIVDITMAGMSRNGTVYEDKIDPMLLVEAYNNTLALLKSKVVVEDNK